jgi:hypothetical protein
MTNSNNPITPTETKNVNKKGDLHKSINDFFIVWFLKEDWVQIQIKRLERVLKFDVGVLSVLTSEC